MKKLGILAYPAKHSLSPQMMNAAFEHLNIDAHYERFEVEPNDLGSFMERFRAEEIAGCSVSLPHKEAIIDFLDEIDGDAKRIGAVNTVLRRGSELVGYNTDWLGVVRALGDDLSGKKAVVLGAGGASRAAVYGLLKKGCQVTILNRSPEKAKMLAWEFANLFGVDVESGPLSALSSGDFLLQMTSIWIQGGKLEEFINVEVLENFGVIFDSIYKPLRTPLIEAAEDIGLKTITGEKMLLEQGYEQFNLWTGQEAPREVMAKSILS